MAIQYGNRITDDSIVFHVDFANRRSFAPNLLNYSHWTVGGAGVGADPTRYGMTTYNRNGDVAENVRVIGTDPFGYANSIVWKSSTVDTTLPSGDGGWNTGNFAIDNSKMYRFSVWTKRDAMTVGPTSSGAFYFGHYAVAAGGGLTFSINKTNGALVSNTYFHTSANPNTSATSTVEPPYLGGLNVWTLVVGHVWPVSTPVALTLPGTNINGLALNGNHPDSGVWTTSGKVGNPISSGDWIWYPPAVFANHRAYLFYSADLTATQSFIYPRVDIVDGLEPTIQELLNGPEPIHDISTSQNVLYPLGTTNFDLQGRGMVFSGTDAERERGIICGTISRQFTANAISVWFKPAKNYDSGPGGGTLIQFGSTNSTNWFMLGLGFLDSDLSNAVVTIVSDQGAPGKGGTAFTGALTFLANNWYNITLSWDSTNSKYLIYINGTEVATVAGSGSYGGRHATRPLTNYMAIGGRSYTDQGTTFYPWGRIFDGMIGSVVVYSRQLTPDEVLTDYNSMLRKYGAN